MAHQSLGRDVLIKIAESLKDISVVEVEPKMEGRNMFLLLAPDATKIKDYKESQGKTEEAPEAEAEAPSES